MSGYAHLISPYQKRPIERQIDNQANGAPSDVLLVFILAPPFG